MKTLLQVPRNLMTAVMCKKGFLFSMMLTWMAAFSADNNKIIQKPNADMIGSWQFKTSYSTGGKNCYTETENYYFFSDHSLVKTKTVYPCTKVTDKEETTIRKWMIVKNNIILLDENGKQEFAYCSKSKVSNLLKGEKIIHQSKDLLDHPYTGLSGDELALNFK